MAPLLNGANGEHVRRLVVTELILLLARVLIRPMAELLVMEQQLKRRHATTKNALSVCFKQLYIQIK